MQDMYMSTQRPSLRKALELRNGYTDLVGPLLEAYRRGCLVAVASLDLVALLAAGENRIEGHQNHNILTVEHVVSVLPGNRMTMYVLRRYTGRLNLRL